MTRARSRDDVTLLDILVDGFDRNDIVAGYHKRVVPMDDEEAAARRFYALSDEARRWKGTPRREHDAGGRRLVAWADLEIRQAGRGLVVRARSPGFSAWWHEREAWCNDPLKDVEAWLAEDLPR